MIQMTMSSNDSPNGQMFGLDIAIENRLLVLTGACRINQNRVSLFVSDEIRVRLKRTKYKLLNFHL